MAAVIDLLPKTPITPADYRLWGCPVDLGSYSTLAIYITVSPVHRAEGWTNPGERRIMYAFGDITDRAIARDPADYQQVRQVCRACAGDQGRQTWPALPHARSPPVGARAPRDDSNRNAQSRPGCAELPGFTNPLMNTGQHYKETRRCRPNRS